MDKGGRSLRLILLLAGLLAFPPPPAQAVDILWNQQFGTATFDFAGGVAVDAAGNVYVAGSTGGTLPGQTASGATDVFLRKYISSGTEVWTRQFGTATYDRAFGVAVDTAGNVYVAGSTGGTLPGQTASGGYDAFLRKYDPTGNELWTRQFGTANWDEAFGVAVDTAGNAYVAGYTLGTLPGQTASGSYDVFLRKYNSSGTELWTRQFGTATQELAFGVAVETAGNVYVAGATNGALPGQTALGANDAFLRKYDPAGNELWTRQFGTANYDMAYGVGVDIAGNVYAVGPTDGALPGQTASGSYDAFLRKYSSGGAELWTRQFGTTTYEEARGVALDAAGNVYVAGHTDGALPGQTASGQLDVFLRKYEPTGTEVWTRQFGTTTTDLALGVALDAAGDVYLAGHTDGVLPGQAASGSLDTFVVKIGVANRPPIANAGADQTVSAGARCQGAVTLDGTGSSDPDGDTLTHTWTWASGTATGPTPTLSLALGTHTITLTVDDGKGGTESDTVVVTIRDTAPPVLSNVPGPIMVEQTGPTGASVTVPMPTVSDCSLVILTHNVPGTFPPGTTTVTFTATDAEGNTATATTSVTVRDTTPPVIGPVSDLTVEATSSAGAVVTYPQPAASDAVSTPTVNCNPASGGTFQLGATTVTCTAIDAAGNTSTKSFTVTVVDRTPPVIGPVSDLTAEASSAAGAVVTFALPPATDAVDPTPVVTASPASGSLFPLGTTAVTVTAKDGSNNSSTKTFTVTVRDTASPTLTVPADIAREATAPLTPVALGTATAVDLVDGPVTVSNNAPAAGFPVGTTLVTWAATDSRGNRATATQQVTVNDTTPPALTVPFDIIKEATAPLTAVPLGAATAVDLVDGAVPVSNNASVAGFPVGTTTVTWTGRDSRGNTATATQRVTITDTTPPAATLGLSPASLWPPNHSMVTITPTLTASDLAGTVTISGPTVTSNEPVDGLGDGDTSPDWIVNGTSGIQLRAERSGTGSGRIYTIIYVVTDQAGNSTTVSATVTVPKSQGK